jgi:AcrR family transcriptional regulator
MVLRMDSGKFSGRPIGGDTTQTRTRILDAATDVFGDHGYHESAVDEIARRSDTSKGTIYFHFANKQNLFVALTDHLVDRLLAEVQEHLDRDPDPVQRVKAAVGTTLGIFARHRSLARILLVDVAGLGRGFDRRLLDIHARIAGMIAAQLMALVDDGAIAPLDTELTAYAWLGAINEVVVRWLYTGEPDPLEAAVPTLTHLLLQSIGLPDAAPTPMGASHEV